MTRAIIASSVIALFMLACAAEDPDSLGGRGRGGDGENGENGGNGGDGSDPDGDGVPGSTPPGAGECKGAPHVGFGNTDFTADRKPGDMGVNRRRVKPFTGLAGEFTRAIGVVPAALAGNAAAFGETPARWYAEPQAGAVSLYTTYNLSFTACYDTMTDAKFQTAPTAATATAECTAMQRKAWQRTPTPEETKACSDLAVGLTEETNARRRWAHACASVLSSVGFTTY